MRVYLLLYQSALFTPDLLESFVLNTKHEVIGVGGVKAKKKGSAVKWLASQVRFWGWKGTLSIAVAQAARKATGLPVFSRALSNRSSLQRVCQSFGIPYEDVGRVNDEQFVSSLASRKPDVIVSMQQQIFKQKLLDTPRVACVNIHTSRLPDYRGFRPVFWGMLHEDTHLGVTLHTMTKEIDAGQIVHQRMFRRPLDASLLENYFWSYCVAAWTLAEGIDILEKSDASTFAPVVPRPDTYFGMPDRNDVSRFIKKGLRLA